MTRAARSTSSASALQAGGRVSLARKAKRHGAGASPGTTRSVKVPPALACCSGGAGSGSGSIVAQGSRRCHQVGTPGADDGTTEEITSWCSARVMATYKAFSSSLARAACSTASASALQAGGRVSLARKAKRHGAGASPGHSHRAPMLSGRLGRPSVSSSSTVGASSPLAPCTVSSRTTPSAATAGPRMPPALSARTNA